MPNDVVHVRARAFHRNGTYRTIWMKMGEDTFNAMLPHMRAQAQACVAQCNPRLGSLEQWTVYDIDAFHQPVTL